MILMTTYPAIFIILRILVLVAIIQTIILLIHLVRMKGRSFSKHILIALFLCFVIFLSGHLFLFLHKKFLFGLAHLANLFVFLSVPILYFYFSSYVDKKSRFKRNDFFHLLPFLIIFLIMAYNLKYNTEEVFVFTGRVYLAWGAVADSASQQPEQP